MFLGSLAFIALGIWIWTIANEQDHFDALYMNALSIVAIAFFGLCAIFCLFKLFDNKPGLIINREGIQDNSSAVGRHFIKWEHITRLDKTEVKSTKILLIFINNPKEFLTNANRFNRFWLKMNNKMYGTPICIASVSLQCNFRELYGMIENERNKHQIKN